MLLKGVLVIAAPLCSTCVEVCKHGQEGLGSSSHGQSCNLCSAWLVMGSRHVTASSGQRTRAWLGQSHNFHASVLCSAFTNARLHRWMEACSIGDNLPPYSRRQQLTLQQQRSYQADSTSQGPYPLQNWHPLTCRLSMSVNVTTCLAWDLRACFRPAQALSSRSSDDVQHQLCARAWDRIGSQPFALGL